jgi:hypothetical protein
MDRMGHSTTCAPLIYQYRTSLRDKMIADEISRRAEAERPDRARSGHETPVRHHDRFGAAPGK